LTTLVISGLYNKENMLSTAILFGAILAAKRLPDFNEIHDN